MYGPATGYYAGPHGMYAAASSGYVPGASQQAPPAVYPFSPTHYGPGQVLPSQQQQQSLHQTVQSNMTQQSSYSRSREASTGSAVSYGPAMLHSTSAQSGPHAVPMRGMPAVPTNGMPPWASSYNAGVGHHQWMNAGMAAGRAISPGESGQSRGSYAQRGGNRRPSRGGAPGSSGPSRGNSFSSSQSAGSFYFPTSPNTAASSYNAAEHSYAPEVAYMGSAFYASPPLGGLPVPRLHHSPPNLPQTSGTPGLGIPTPVQTSSPAGSSPLSISRVNTSGPDPEATAAAPSTSRRSKPGRDPVNPKSAEVSASQTSGAPMSGSPSAVTTQLVERSEHVMWVGNVPQDATVKELFELFSQVPEEPTPVASEAEGAAGSSEALPGAEAGPTPIAESAAGQVALTSAVSNQVPGDLGGVVSPSGRSLVASDYAKTEQAEHTKESMPTREDPDVSPSTHGIVSIFPISRSNCAFVNYATADHLARAVTRFTGRPVRPHDKRCLPMICRVRKKDDEDRAGVAGQRGRGMHVEWVKEHERKRKAAVAAAKKSENAASETAELAESVPSIEFSAAGPSQSKTPTLAESCKRTLAAGEGSQSDTTPRVGPVRPPLVGTAVSANPDSVPTMVHDSSSSSLDTSSMGSLSYTSTNSSVLRHPAFKVRYFILKSKTRDDLDQSVQSGKWATQAHNEGVLDQAFRLSAKVILIFGANQSGEFFGYAKMSGPVRPSLETGAQSSSSGGSSNSSGRLSASSGISPSGPSHRSNISPGGLLPVMLEESDESSRRGSLPTNASDVSASVSVSDSRRTSVANAFLSPAMTGLPPDGTLSASALSCVASPLQLTPATEEESLDSRLPHAGDEVEHPATWPTALTNAAPKAEVEDSRRGATLSPQLLAQGIRAPVPAVIPVVHAEENTAGFANASGRILEAPAQERSQSEGPFGGYGQVRRRTGASSAENDNSRSSEGSKSAVTRADITSPNLSDSSSLAPNDSASDDARAAQQLAMRAIIHNLRIDERESTRQAEELENALKVSETTAEDEAAGGSSERKAKAPAVPKLRTDVLGRPFAVTWLQTKPLPFRRVQHLRNPWRDNRQIKVSRDGTELESSVGDQLIAEWERFVAEEQEEAQRSESVPAEVSRDEKAEPATEEEEED
ncbi:hypothetical protein V8E36_008422 [Tilletia maclaganii]